MATRLYPPVTEDVLSAFCLTYEKGTDNTEPVGVTIKVDFQLNKAVAASEIGAIVLRLRTISTNTYIITEKLNPNPNVNVAGVQNEGYAISKDLTEGTCIFQINKEYNPDVVEALHIGQHYKIQLAFVDLNGIIGYWSNVATIKCVAEPALSIANYDETDANPFTNVIVGCYEQNTNTGDSSEKVYSYQFQLWDKNGTIIDDSGICLHDSSQDTSSSSSTDIFYCYKELNNNTIYYLRYSVTTINGLKANSPTYCIIIAESLDMQQPLTLTIVNGLEEDYWTDKKVNRGFAWAPWEEGVIRINADIPSATAADQTHTTLVTGNYVLLRSSSKDNFGSWQEIRRFRFAEEEPYDKIIYDFTVEQGITYRYALQQYNRAGFYSKKVYGYKVDKYNSIIYNQNGDPVYADVIADFEDMFLYDGDKQLKIKFNPKVNSFKNDLQEQKIDTIGSKHPFIFRNGNICYKEFPISGLISFQTDEAKFFMDDNDYAQMGLSRFEADFRRGSPAVSTNITYQQISYDNFPSRESYIEPLYVLSTTAQEFTGHENTADESAFYDEVEKKSYKPLLKYEDALYAKNHNISLFKQVTSTQAQATGTQSKTNLTSENIMSERYFKLKVLDWLTDGKPKLFRSPTEGNYIVRLLNVSLTPKTELGRMIHEFTCTAYEIADFNYDSLVDLGLLNIAHLSTTENQWYSQNIKDLFNTDPSKDGYYSVDLKEKTLLGIHCVGFAPGDQIKITLENNTIPLIVTIGQTGTYIYEGATPIISVGIKPVDGTEDLARSLLLATVGYTYQKFDMISSIGMHTQTGDQLIGPVKNYFETTIVGSDNNNNNYYQSNNVYLSEDFEKVNVNEDNFESNKYYFYIGSGDYALATEYDPTVDYYQRVANGVKIYPSEILYLHAKRREVIPIFMRYEGNGNMGLIDVTNPASQKFFMVTSYGNGYIRRKSISTNADFPLGNLDEAERTESMTIGELVDFAYQNMATDIFCLFEVYVPLPIPEAGGYNWVKYCDSNYQGGPDIGAIEKPYGIYDPWLASQYKEAHPDDADWEKYGWWTDKKGYTSYEPNFTYNDSLFSLAEENEITMKNIAVPSVLSIGNGAVMELIYRITFIDYILESENVKLRLLKEAYLSQKEIANKNVALWRGNLLTKQSGETLMAKYALLLAQAEDYNTYGEVIYNLTNTARTKQIVEKLQSYFNNEKAIINSYLNQIRNIDVDLVEEFGSFYANHEYRIYKEDGALAKAKTKYLAFIDYILELIQSGDIATNTAFGQYIKLIDYYGTLNNPNISFADPNNAVASARGQIVNLYNHIDGSNDYNFPRMIENLKNNYQREIIKEIEDELEDLGNSQYVAEYDEIMEEKGRQVFFTDFVPNVDGYNDYKTYTPTGATESENNIFWKSDFAPYQIINKNINTGESGDTIINKLQNTSILATLNGASLTDNAGGIIWANSDWNTSFHLDREDDFPRLILKTDGPNGSTYYLDNNDDITTLYKDSSFGTTSVLVQGDEDSSLFAFIKLLIHDINEKIETGTQAKQIKKYQSHFGRALNPPVINVKNNERLFKDYFQIAEIFYEDEEPSFIQTSSKLQAILISLTSMISDYDGSNLETITEKVWAEIEHSYNWIYNLPNGGWIAQDDDETQLNSILLKDIVKHLVKQYISLPDIGNYYREVLACINYKNDHPELTQQQIEVIKAQINSYKQAIDTLLITPTTTSATFYVAISPNLGVDNNPQNQLLDTIDKTLAALRISLEYQQNSYDAIGNADITADRARLDFYISYFNYLVGVKNSSIKKFKTYVERLVDITSKYNSSDNIREILTLQLEFYNEAYNALSELLDQLRNNIDVLQQNVIFEAYLQFLYTYVDYVNNSDTSMSQQINTYKQLYEQAKAMSNIEINDEYSPINQQALVTEKWKQFLDELSNVYQNEIKEKMSE